MATLAREAHDRQRDRDRTDETTHVFCLPDLAAHREGTLREAGLVLDAEAQATQVRLAAIQAQIDDLVFDLYGLSESNRALVQREMGTTEHAPRNTDEDEPDADEEPPTPEDLPRRVADLLQWCVGVAFGRWDVRLALPSPSQGDPLKGAGGAGVRVALPGPFDPLPRCAPGALVGPDGLPVSASPHLAIPQDGILVDDPTHPSDIVTRVRQVLTLLWGHRADAIEREACDILGVRALRDYFRDPRGGFFAFHIRRYSKSRRKAPIYWLLQSERRSYAIWLYAHRLTPVSLYVAGRDYADAKAKLEETRLEELRQGLAALEGSARKRREQEIERQQRLVAEVTDFRKRLDAVALRNLPPDLNDGVLISIAPLWELTPWKEAQRTWEALLAGEYPWSTMARRIADCRLRILD